MARKKYKMTGCARFFFAILIIAPIAYFGASYYNGENPVENIKSFLGIEEDTRSGDQDTYTGTSESLLRDLKKKDQRIEDLIDENTELKEKIDNLEKEIKYFKQLLEAQ